MAAFHNVLIVGLAASGRAAARLLLAEGARVTVLDRGAGPVLESAAAALRREGAAVCLGSDAPPAGAFDAAVVSPGVPAGAPALRALQARGVPLVSELELGWSRARSRVLAISGSNGKSTLAKLCAEALALAGCRPALAGNYGPPACAAVLEDRAGARPPAGWLVLEASSFQLETVSAFRPDVGVLLNVTPNHLDRHGDFDTYRRMKARLFAAMAPGDTAIVGAPDLAAIRALAGSPARWQSAGAEPGADFWYRAGRVMNRQGLAPVPLAGTRFDNPVLGLTAAAAAAALAACGVDGRFLAEAARRFEPLPHRLQEIGEAGGIRWVDDSKATNLAALMAALSLARAPVRLIAGGRAKGESYEPARGLLSQKVAAAYLIGESAGLMAEAWRGATRCVLSGALEQAVAEAAREARSGETILLSPACASFDQYPGYAERGAAFARAAQKILDTMSANSDSPSADFMARKNV